MTITQLPTTKTAPNQSLRNFRCLIHGGIKIGKTEFVNKFPNLLLIATEPGYSALSVYPVDVRTWQDFLDVIALVESGRHIFELVCIDTIECLYNMCGEHICQRYRVDHESDMDMGKGWALIRAEFSRAMNRLAHCPYGLIMIGHSLLEEVGRGKNKVKRATLNLPDKSRKPILAMVDLVLYFDYDSVIDEKGNVTSTRVIRTKGTAEWEAGDRTGYLPETMPLDFDVFKAELQEAWRKRAAGATPGPVPTDIIDMAAEMAEPSPVSPTIPPVPPIAVTPPRPDSMTAAGIAATMEAHRQSRMASVLANARKIYPTRDDFWKALIPVATPESWDGITLEKLAQVEAVIIRDAQAIEDTMRVRGPEDALVQPDSLPPAPEKAPRKRRTKAEIKADRAAAEAAKSPAHVAPEPVPLLSLTPPPVAPPADAVTRIEVPNGTFTPVAAAPTTAVTIAVPGLDREFILRRLKDLAPEEVTRYQVLFGSHLQQATEMELHGLTGIIESLEK